jgi:hypothetical protein
MKKRLYQNSEIPDSLTCLTTLNIGHKQGGNKLKNPLDPKIYPNRRV